MMRKLQSADGLWHPPLWLGFLWGFAEGTLFFIIPDMVLAWATLSGVKRGARMAGAVLAGSILAGTTMYLFATLNSQLSHNVVASVPFVRPGMFDHVIADYQAHGPFGVLRGPSSGIPYKVYAVSAPQFCSLVVFLLLSIPARLERLALSWIISLVIGKLFGGLIAKHKRWAACLFASYWVAAYAIYWTTL